MNLPLHGMCHSALLHFFIYITKSVPFTVLLFRGIAVLAATCLHVCLCVCVYVCLTANQMPHLKVKRISFTFLFIYFFVQFPCLLRLNET